MITPARLPRMLRRLTGLFFRQLDSSSRKVFIVSLDGATFDVFRPSDYCAREKELIEQRLKGLGYLIKLSSSRFNRARLAGIKQERAATC
jgi:hypothetical protein